MRVTGEQVESVIIESGEGQSEVAGGLSDGDNGLSDDTTITREANGVAAFGGGNFVGVHPGFGVLTRLNGGLEPLGFMGGVVEGEEGTQGFLSRLAIDDIRVVDDAPDVRVGLVNVFIRKLTRLQGGLIVSGVMRDLVESEQEPNRIRRRGFTLIRGEVLVVGQVVTVGQEVTPVRILIFD